MTYSEIASGVANTNFVFWLLCFTVTYVIFFWIFRKQVVKALLFGGVAVLSFFTLLNILSSPFVMFGGGADNLNAFESGHTAIYLVHICFVWFFAVLFFAKHRLSPLAVVPLLVSLVYLSFMYYLLFFPFVLGWIVIWILAVLYARRFVRAGRWQNLMQQLKKPKPSHYGISAAVFLLSLIWVGCFLYRNREVVFDCSMMRTDLMASLKAQPKTEDVLALLGQPTNSATNYFNIRYSKADTTYFYCPTPLVFADVNSCTGFRVTADEQHVVREIQKRGLSCARGPLPLEISPFSDSTYYFYWSSDMWSFDFTPSEHYVMKDTELTWIIAFFYDTISSLGNLFFAQ